MEKNRGHKNSLFIDLFYQDETAKKNLLSLYNALHDTEYQDENVIRKVKMFYIRILKVIFPLK